MGGSGVSKKAAKAERLPGPLAPWRLAIAVAVSALLTGSKLIDAVSSSVGVAFALIRSVGVAFIVWIALGIINKVLVTATMRAIVAELTGEDHR